MNNERYQLGCQMLEKLHGGHAGAQIEVILQMSIYAGMASASNALRMAKEVFSNLDQNDETV